ncbi:MAG: hypothetical protein KG003_12690 [Bacteroidetes bacterium]|nr:hypothetical protein [Bacteroidota bacterium]
MIFSCSFFSVSSLSAQQKPKPTLDFKVLLSQNEPQIGDTIEITFKANLEPNYHLYGIRSDCPPDDGPIRADFHFDQNDGIQLIGACEGIGDSLMLDEVFKCSTSEFSKSCEFRQKVKILGVVKDFTVHFQGQQCSAVSGECFLVQNDLVIPVSVKSGK